MTTDFGTSPGPGAGGDGHRTIGEDFREVRREATERAREAAGEARHRLNDYASRQKESAARQIGSIAETMRDTARQLGDRKEQRWVTDYANRAAGTLEKVAGELETRDVGELVSSAEEFARRNPALVFGGGLLVGLAIARFLKSSAEGAEPSSDGEGERQDSWQKGDGPGPGSPSSSARASDFTAAGPAPGQSWGSQPPKPDAFP